MNIELPLKYRAILGIIVIASLSVVAAADLGSDYKYDKEFTIEKVSNPPQTDINPVKFDNLSNSEQHIILSKLAGQTINDNKLPSEFNKAGYVSINGQLYKYEVTPTVSKDTSNIIIEFVISFSLFISSVLFIASFAEQVTTKYNMSIQVNIIFFFGIILLLGVFPATQIATFSTTTVQTGTIAYLGPTDSTENAIQYSELSYHQQAYVSELTSHYSYNSPGDESSPIMMPTTIPTSQLHELDTVVLKTNGNTKYYNFVTTETEYGIFNLTFYEQGLSIGLLIAYLICSILLFGITINEIE